MFPKVYLNVYCLYVFLLLLFSSQITLSQNVDTGLPTTASSTQTSLSNIPNTAQEQAKKQKQNLRFSKNIGQMDQAVLYQVNDLQVDHYFLANEIRTVLQHNSEPSQEAKHKPQRKAPKNRGPSHGQEERNTGENEEISQTIYSYGLRFLGTAGPEKVIDLRPEIVQSVGKKNYIKGNGRFTDIPQYGQIQYKSLWEGIDVDFYETKKQLKYDFIVAPFADPSQIKFSLNGVSEVPVDQKTGELAFLTPFGELRKGRKPYFRMGTNYLF